VLAHHLDHPWTNDVAEVDHALGVFCRVSVVKGDFHGWKDIAPM
jgi:hypothetical protein